MKWTFARHAQGTCGKKCCNCKSSATIARHVKLVTQVHLRLHRQIITAPRHRNHNHSHNHSLRKTVNVQQDQLDHLDHLDAMEKLVRLENLEIQDHQEKMEPYCLPRLLRHHVKNAPLDHLVNLVKLDPKDHPAHLEMREHLVLMENPASLDHLDHLDPKVFLASQATRAHLASLVKF